MTLTLVHGSRCAPCKEFWHFLCWARRDALCPDECACGCIDDGGLLTETAWEESARRAPAQLARHLRFQQAADPFMCDTGVTPDWVHPESVEWGDPA